MRSLAVMRETGLPGRVRRDALGAVAGRAGQQVRRPARIRAGAGARGGRGRHRRHLHGNASRSGQGAQSTARMRGRWGRWKRCWKRCWSMRRRLPSATVSWDPEVTSRLSSARNAEAMLRTQENFRHARASLKDTLTHSMEHRRATTITRIHAREILDCRGNPTLEAEVTLADGAFGRARGAERRVHRHARSGGTARRRQDALSRQGRDARRSPTSTATIAKALKGFDAADQDGLDDKLIALDGTPNKERLGANALLGVSLADGARGRGIRRRAAVAAISRGDRARRAAGADDEHHQRRRARGQQRRHAGIHGPAGRLRRRFPRRCARASRSSTR